MRPVRVPYHLKLSVKCPACNAAKGKHCKAMYDYRYEITNLHRERRLAYLDWAVKDASARS